MSILQPSTRIAAFAAANLLTLCIHGAVLLGADRLATQGEAQWAAAQEHTTLVAQQRDRDVAL